VRYASRGGKEATRLSGLMTRQLVLLFLASFFPVGAFLLPTDHWLKWVGWVDLGLLVAAVLLWLTRRREVVSA